MRTALIYHPQNHAHAHAQIPPNDTQEIRVASAVNNQHVQIMPALRRPISVLAMFTADDSTP